MFIKQVSVFLENREGRLQSALQALKDRKINIVSLSLADTSEYGMLRMIVSDSEKAKEALKESGLSAKLTDVIAIKLPHTVGSLQQVISLICEAGINIEYMYALSTRDENACIVIKATDTDAVEKALKDKTINFITEEELRNF